MNILEGDPRSRSLRIACEKCNNGWMSDIYNKATTSISKLYDGKFVELGPQDLPTVARYACLFTMSHEFHDPETLTTSQLERDFIRETGNPPANWHVAVGNYTGVTWDGQVWHKSFATRPDDSDSDSEWLFQTTTIGIGRAIIHTLSAHNNWSANIPKIFAGMGLATIWSPQEHEYQPPTRWLTDREANLIPEILPKLLRLGSGFKS